MSESPDTEYTPTTDDIIRAYSLPLTSANPRLPNESFAEWLGRGSIETHSHQMASERAARRWLAAHDAEVAAKALEDGAGNWAGAVSRAWLRARAARIREGSNDTFRRI